MQVTQRRPTWGPLVAVERQLLIKPVGVVGNPGCVLPFGAIPIAHIPGVIIVATSYEIFVTWFLF